MTSCFRRWAGSAAVATLVTLAGCSGGTGGTGGTTSTAGATACGRVETLIDSRANSHVIDENYAEYDFHPPTSGLHFGGQPPRLGVYDEPLPEAKQVLVLEVGGVVLQYDDSVAATAVARLEALAEAHDEVVVTPAAGAIDGGKPVAFTAWQRRQLCDGVSDAGIADEVIADEVIAAAEEWITRYAGKPPSGS